MLVWTSCRREACPGTGDFFPSFTNMEWMQSPPVDLRRLRGKVVLIRWWTDGCVYCANSSEALNEWYEAYHQTGLEVLGIYHPKPRDHQPGPEEVREYAQEKDFRFPIGLDLRWQNLEKVWLSCGEKPFTSVSFLLDKQGRIAYIHPGGEYHRMPADGHEQCVRDYLLLDSLIRTHLKDP